MRIRLCFPDSRGSGCPCTTCYLRAAVAAVSAAFYCCSIADSKIAAVV